MLRIDEPHPHGEAQPPAEGHTAVPLPLLPVEAGLAALPALRVSAADAGRLARGQAVLLRGRDAPVMATPEMLLHAMRLALVQRIWLLATRIPDFSTRYGVTRESVEMRLLRLDVSGTLALLGKVFPDRPDPAGARSFHEPPAPRATGSYVQLHDEVFSPISRCFGLVREISTAISHEVGAFG